jgi:tRNA G18 (ribose-2'-O)-methylase SpoU
MRVSGGIGVGCLTSQACVVTLRLYDSTTREVRDFVPSWREGVVVVMAGAEGGGLSRLVHQTYDQIVSIPIADTVESLNAVSPPRSCLYAVAQA